jgi:alpha-beta hydrolase superfamily lysophospholipase
MNCAIKKLLTVMVTITGALLLSACPSENNSAPEGKEPSPNGSVAAQALFSPFTGVVPLPTNLFFQPQTGQAANGTLNIPSSSPPAVAASQLDGWSTIAPAIVNFSEAIESDTVESAVRLLHLCLNPADKSPIPGGYTPDTLIPNVNYRAELSAVDDTQVLVKPLIPLRSKFDPNGPCVLVDSDPSEAGHQPAENGYIVAISNAIETSTEQPFAGSDVYELLSQPTCYYRFAASDPLCTNPGDGDDGSVGLTPAGADAGLATASEASQQSTENLRRLTAAQEGITQLLTAGAFGPDNIILSFSFSTQSIGTTMAAVKALAAADAAAQIMAAGTDPVVELEYLGVNTSALGAFGAGDVYKGSVQLPYYLPLPTAATDSAINSGSWLTANNQSPYILDTTPVKTGDVTVPVFAVMPRFIPGTQTPLPAGIDVPTAIVQHGITSNRTQILAIAEALAAAGVATVAIDLPLHGVVDENPPFNLVRVPYDYDTKVGERTFDIDLVTNAAAGADACAPNAVAPTTNERDSSGAHFINLPSLLTSRDNLRQAVADLLSLEKQLPEFSWVKPTMGPPEIRGVDESKMYFVGHSLGGIVGGTFLALADDIAAASLLNPGGGIAKLLDASAAFGPVVSGGLAGQGVLEGTSNYEQFLFFAQTVVDSGDPLNYTAALEAKLSSMPLHSLVIAGGATSVTLQQFDEQGAEDGTITLDLSSFDPPAVLPPDLVVPNDAFNAIEAFGEVIPVSGLGGTVPLYEQLGLTEVTHEKDSSNPQVITSVKHVVRLDSGSHTSPLRPASAAPSPLQPGSFVCVVEDHENGEILNQLGNFFGSQGACLPIDTSCPPPGP